jgi:hypothetical protein
MTDSMKRTGMLILAGLATIAMVMADGTGSNAGLRRTAGGTTASKSGAETGLVGIKLYDTAIDLVRRFGNPDDVQTVGGGGGGAVGPAGGGGQGAAAGGARAGGGRGGGAAGGSSVAEWMLPPSNKDAFSTIGLFQGGQEPTFAGAGAGGAAGGQGGGAPTAAGAPGAGGGGGQGAGGAQQGQDARILYTRWVYKRGNSRFAFILNRYGQIIQIEAIGSNDSRVVTNRGTRYGAKFADIIRAYGVPDAYEINGNSLVVRYLVKNKVAFRLNRLKDDAPHVVTGIVVAAGKA